MYNLTGTRPIINFLFYSKFLLTVDLFRRNTKNAERVGTALAEPAERRARETSLSCNPCLDIYTIIARIAYMQPCSSQP